MVQSRVDEDTAVIPSSRFDPDRLVDQRALPKRLVRDRDGCPASIFEHLAFGKLTVLA